FVRLHRHALGELGDRDALRDLHLAHDRRRRPFESVLALGAQRHGTAAERRLALAAPALVAGDVQFLAAVTGLGGLRRRGRRLLLLLLAPLACILLGAFEPCLFLRRGARGRLAGFLLRLLACGIFLALVFLGACLLFPFGAEALLLALLGLEPLLLLAAPAVELGLFLLCLLLEDVALDVGALAPYLDVHRARAALGTGQPQLGLRLALERDALGRGRQGGVLAMAAPQVRQELELRFLADGVFGSAHLASGLVELPRQLVHP